MSVRSLVIGLVTTSMVLTSCSNEPLPSFTGADTTPSSTIAGVPATPTGTSPSEPATMPDVAPQLVPDAAPPGHGVVLMHPSIVAGEPTTVGLTDGPVHIAYPVTPDVDGQLVLIAPPSLDGDGTLTSGTYDVTLPATTSTVLTIELPPPHPGGAPGTVIRAVLAQTIVDLRAGRQALRQLGDTTGIDVDPTRQAARAVIGDLEQQIEEYDTTGTFSISGAGGTVDLKPGQLRRIDRLLTSYLDGLIEQLDGPRAMATRAPGEHARPPRTAPPATTEERLAEVRRLRAQINGGTTVLTGAAAMLVTALGAILAGTTLGASALFAFLAGLGTTIVVGTAAEGLAAIEAYLTGGSWEFGQAFTSTMLSSFLNLGVTIGAEVNTLINIGSFLYTGEQVRGGIHQLVCNTRPIPERYIDFCDRYEIDFGATGPVRIGRAWYSPELIAPGITGTLFVPVIVGTSKDVSLNVDWGTGEADDAVTVADSQVLKFPHAFQLDEDAIITIKMHAIDDEGNEAFQNAVVNVTDDAALRVNVTSIPVQMTTLNRYTWGFEISGGKADYTATIRFGDGSERLTREFSSTGTFTVDHAYDRAGRYEVRVDLVDELEGSASTTLTAKVRDPVEIVSFEGPDELDRNEDGTWTVQVEPGWGPYELEIDWGDDTDPFTTTMDGTTATATHRYGKNGDYTITAIVTSDVKLSANATTTVTVPRPPLAFSGSATETCQIGANSDTHEGPFTGEVNTSDRTVSLLATQTGFAAVGQLADDGSFEMSGTLPQPNGDPSNYTIEGQLDIDRAAQTVTGWITGTQTWPTADAPASCTFRAEI